MIRRIILTLFLGFIMTCFTACSKKVNKGVEIPKGQFQDYNPGVSAPPPEYRIGFGDILEVKFFYDPELDETLLVRSDGRITLPRLGDIMVAGLTPTQLDSIVTTKYGEILKNPDITVQVRNSAETVVYVLGEVNNPSVVPIRGRLTVLQAIAASRGFTRTAKTSSVIVFHSNGIDRPTSKRLNLSKVFSRKNLSDNIALSGYDIVYVPQTFIGKLDLFVDQFFDNVFPPLLDTYIKGYQAYRIKERYDYFKSRIED